MKTNYLALLCLLCATPAFAERTYDLSERAAVVGEKIETQGVFEGKKGKMTLVIDGATVGEGTTQFRSTSTTRKTVTEVVDGVTQAYEETKVTQKTVTTTDFMGNKTNEEKSSPLVDAKVTYKLVDGEYVPHLPDATEEQKEELEAEPYSDASPYPDKPIAVGHKWDLSPEVIAVMMDQPIDGEGKGKGTIKFVAVIEHKGEPCAQLDTAFELEAPIPTEDLPEGVSSGSFKMKLTGTIYRSLKDHIDIEAKVKGEATYIFNIEEQGQAISIVTVMPCELTSTERLLD